MLERAPEILKYDEPIGEMSYHEWKNFLMSSKRLRRIAAYIEENKIQIIYPNRPKETETMAQIGAEIQKMKESYNRERTEWLIFWVYESITRYGQFTAIGLF